VGLPVKTKNWNGPGRSKGGFRFLFKEKGAARKMNARENSIKKNHSVSRI